MTKRDIKEFIELDRRFQEVTEESLSDELAYESYAGLFQVNEGIPWNKLLEHKLVVILGEAGSGKTQEFKEQARKLQGLGKNAFFIRLDELVDQDINIALDPKDKIRFDKWMRGSQSATFFLDSVDEAKLKSYEAFETALKKLLAAIQSSRLNRARFVVSSRIIEWRWYADSETLFNIFSSWGVKHVEALDGNSEVILKDDDKRVVKPFVVKILPLTKKQVELFSSMKGLDNQKAFIEALDIHNAWAFAGRPVDVEQLIQYWEEHGCLGSLSKLIEYDIEQKLAERSERIKHGVPVSKAQKREGLEFLAASVTLCQTPHLRIEEGEPHVDDISALVATECLPSHWVEHGVRSLLSCAVFDVATYGRIRFHHKSITEYLTASWLNNRMLDGCDFPSLENILFEPYEGIQIPRRGLEPIIGWLALGENPWNKRIRTNLKECDPEILLSYGDPESLPLAFKQEILLSLLSKYKGRKRAFFHTDRTGLQRFADARLAPLINQLLADESLPDDIKADLINMVSAKKILDCLDTILEISITPSHEYLQAFAVDVVGELGSQKHMLVLGEYVDRCPSIASDISAHLCIALYPKFYSAEQLVSLIQKTMPPADKTVGASFYLRTLIEKDTPDADLQVILKGLLAFIEKSPYKVKNNKELKISEGYFWLNEIVSILIYLILTRLSTDKIEYDLLARGMHIFACAQEINHRHYHIPEDFKQVVDKHSMLKREFYRLRIKEIGKQEGKKETLPSAYEVFNYYSDIDLNLGDLDWLLEETQKSSSYWHKRVTMNMAIDLWYRWGRKYSVQVRIKSQVRSDELLYKEFKEKTKFRPILRLKGYMRTSYHRGDWWRFKRSILNKYSSIRDIIWLHRNIKQLREGKALHALSTLVHDARSKSESSNQWAAESLEPLIEKFGKRIAYAARDGWIQVWESFTPSLPYEKPSSNQTDYRVIIGLSGIHAAINYGGLNIDTLSEKDAKRACRYALNELNGFPSWFTSLVYCHPQIVKGILSESIEHEWLFKADQESVHQVLYHISYHTDLLGALVSEDIINALGDKVPDNLQISGFALTILFSEAATYRDRLAQIAKRECASNDMLAPKFAIWFSTWIQLDAKSALEYLESKLNFEGVKDFIITLCSSLGFDRFLDAPPMPNPDYLQAKHLRKFIPIVYRFVRPGDDIDRTTGGVYSPSQRDRAQDFRNGLLNKLAEMEGAEAQLYLKELYELPELADRKEWILHLLDKRASLFAVAEKWKPKDIISFSEQFAVEPKSDHELFKVLGTALLNIKDDVERGDISSRKDLHDKSDEADMRTWLARQLIQQAKDRYKVPQEEEIDLQKRPDLRIEKPRLNPISIEMKVADNWTPKELVESINKQLIGQYLRSTKSNYGVFMIGYVGRKPYWVNPETSAHMSFKELVDYLSTIVPEQGVDYDGLWVIGIDFTVPK